LIMLPLSFWCLKICSYLMSILILNHFCSFSNQSYWSFSILLILYLIIKVWISLFNYIYTYFANHYLYVYNFFKLSILREIKEKVYKIIYCCKSHLKIISCESRSRERIQILISSPCLLRFPRYNFSWKIVEKQTKHITQIYRYLKTKTSKNSDNTWRVLN
jgi:hypothetical protein